MYTKLIYFPKRHESSPHPIVIVTDGTLFDGEYKGNQDLGELEKERFQFFSEKRCRPYSDELWTACIEWVARKGLLESDFQKLMHGVIP